MDRGNVRKHVGFYSKNKFEKLKRLVGFIIRTLNYHESYQRTKLNLILAILLTITTHFH